MKIVTFFTTVVAAVLLGFLIFSIRTNKNTTRGRYLHVLLSSRNDDGFRLRINSTEFNFDQAEEGDLGRYSYIGKVLKTSDSAHIHFKESHIDTTFNMDVANIDTIAIGVNNNGRLYLKKF